MKRREITQTGTTTNDGHLAMYMGELKEFFKAHKNCRIIARFTVYTPGTSEALKGYYYNYVVPQLKIAIWERGERLTNEQTEARLREISPIMHEEEVNEASGKYTTRIRNVAELSNAELVEHIEFIMQMAAEEYSLYIEDPKII